MKYRIILITVLLLLSVHYGNTQSLSPGGLVTQGTSASGGGVHLQATVGVPFSNTLENSQALTQGLQQPELQIWPGNLAASVCAGGNLSVTFEVSGIIDPANVFTAQLSNAAGSFTSPVNIGSVVGNICGAISATIPANTPAGNGYRVRVISSLVPFTSPPSSPITINSVVASIPTAFAYPTGTAPFTVYFGWAPAGSITLTATPTSGTAPFTYAWSTGSTTQSTTVTASLPAGSRNVSVTITDALGCSRTITQTIQVVDVRCGARVTVCAYSRRSGYTTTCVATAQVATNLSNGATLGSCPATAAKQVAPPPLEEKAKQPLVANAVPNPSPGYFTVLISGGSDEALQIRVTDAVGRLIESRLTTPNASLRIGERYLPGIYFIELFQGKERVVLKVVKSGN